MVPARIGRRNLHKLGGAAMPSFASEIIEDIIEFKTQSDEVGPTCSA
jgi:hypothetical protein